MADENSLKAEIASTALAFRGYNFTNLGRTQELAAIPAYRAIVHEELARFSGVCGEIIGKRVDLTRRVADQNDPVLADYAEAVALVVAVESAQLRLLQAYHGINPKMARLTFGYSLGELHAVCISGMFNVDELLRIPLALATDCASMAEGCTLAVLFSRGPAISEEAVLQLCSRITSRGASSIGISAILSPNTFLLIGQGDSVQQFREKMKAGLPAEAHLRINEHLWPPMHTRIVRQKYMPDRAGLLLDKTSVGTFPPQPDVISLVTGKRSYTEQSARDILRNWVDHPQRLWDAMCEALSAGVTTVLHFGPAPNVIPATFARLSENLREQINGKSPNSYRARAISSLARRPWLASILPARAALLRAPFVNQVIVEDWLIANAPK